MFKPRFASLVESGAKLQTIRPIPKRMPVIGDELSLRAWTGHPYWSKQRILRESTVTGVYPVRIIKGGIMMGGAYLPPGLLESFALADGFTNSTELFDWFEKEHGLPFDGIVTHWNGALSDGGKPHE